MNLSWHDAVGALGVLLIVAAYFMIQTGRWTGAQLRYALFNLAGALLIIVSLLFEFNLSAFLMEAAWVVISIMGIRRAIASRQRP